MSSRLAGPYTARTPATSAMRASASASACRLAAANASSTSTVTSCSDSRPNRLAADRPRSTISVPGGAQANGLRAARAACAGTITPTAVMRAARAQRPAVTDAKLTRAARESGYRMNVAARETATLRSASASDRMLDSISSWYSRRRCVFSRYGPSVLMV